MILLGLVTLVSDHNRDPCINVLTRPSGDDQNDPEGCIFTKNLLVADVTADEINAAVASVSATPSRGAASAASSAVVASASAVVASSSSSSAAVANAAASTPSASAAASAAGATGTVSGDLGSCAGDSPFILFGAGFDGRKEDSFEPADKATFNHGSAQKIGIVADFICDQLSSKCKASQDVVDQCNAGTKAATASGVSGQAAADAFNSAFS